MLYFYSLPFPLFLTGGDIGVFASVKSAEQCDLMEPSLQSSENETIHCRNHLDRFGVKVGGLSL